MNGTSEPLGRVTPQAAQALSTGIHIVGEPDGDNGRVEPADLAGHQNHLERAGQCDGSG